ncbi:MAG: aminotransferase class V-fold PLP-dependent enzyme, partial [Flavobacteriaceae bacterium]|nr:aminotransferase class V-fold PLP-dependent enzyme [Flavobacteriaceae bacterium]
MFNVEKIRKDFPILKREVNGKPLIYFDNAATSQTPQIVIDSIVDYYSNYNANIHRGVHTLSQEATNAYEKARVKIQ